MWLCQIRMLNLWSRDPCNRRLVHPSNGRYSFANPLVVFHYTQMISNLFRPSRNTQQTLLKISQDVPTGVRVLLEQRYWLSRGEVPPSNIKPNKVFRPSQASAKRRLQYFDATFAQAPYHASGGKHSGLQRLSIASLPGRL